MAQSPCQELNRTLTSLHHVPKGRLCCWCVHLWPAGAALRRLIAGWRIKLRYEAWSWCVHMEAQESLPWLCGVKPGAGGKGKVAPGLWTHSNFPAYHFKVPKNSEFETGLPGNNKGVFVKVEDGTYFTEQSVAWFKYLHIGYAHLFLSFCSGAHNR